MHTQVFSGLHNLSPANHLSGNSGFDFHFKDTYSAFDLLWVDRVKRSTRKEIIHSNFPHYLESKSSLQHS